MKISLKTRGGWGAPVYLGLPPRTVDLDTLPQETAAAVSRLAEAAKAAPAPSAPPQPPSVPSPMSHTITIEDGGAPVVLHQSDSMSPAFEALLNWLNDHFAAQSSGGR
jgi:hypothetical protein